MARTLADAFRIRSNFLRSVHLERDARAWLEDQTQFIFTEPARRVMGQVVDSLLLENQPRAWTITGPYGTGKSASMLALTRLLSEGADESRLYRDLKTEDPILHSGFEQVYRRWGPFTPVLVTGTRSLLGPALHAGLLRGVDEALRVRQTPELKQLRDVISNVDPNDVREIVGLFEHASRVLGGVLLIIDELGKFLEYVSERPDIADVFILQELAEAAARSGNAPLLVMGVLHQAFTRYTGHLAQAQRDELGKVQGRFVDVAFVQGLDQLIRLLSAALEFVGSPSQAKVVADRARHLANRVIELGVSVGPSNREVLREQLIQCAPIHPITAILLARLARNTAQNERSIFAFLSSSEPFGFMQYLHNTPVSDDMTYYSPAMLYDYIASSLGTVLYQDVSGRLWAEVEETLARINRASHLETEVIKTVGIIAATREFGEFRATPEVLSVSLGLSEDLTGVLKDLVKRGALVYRSFVGSYRLWSGSDIDIESRLAEARHHVDESTSLDALLGRLLPLRPIVARRHSFEKGTLRFFEVSYVIPEGLEQALRVPALDGDGKVIYVLGDGVGLHEHVKRVMQGRGTAQPDNAVIVPIQVPLALRGIALDVQRLQWVQGHTPELSGDQTAQRELNAQLYQAEQLLMKELEHALDPAQGELLCYYQGHYERVRGSKGLNQVLSQVCDTLFTQAPTIRNELLNRKNLSSAAAAARHVLLERMLGSSSNANLGIEGHPPELSMYYSLLSNAGIHRQVHGVWKFTAPDSESAFGPVWGVWEEFLAESRSQRKSLGELWDRLRRPPFGLRDGVIPVIILAMTLERHVEIGLYESGTFLTEWAMPHVERFTKNPGKFEVRFCPIDGARRDVFDELRRVGLADGSGRILSAVRNLCTAVTKLPKYTQRTQSLPRHVQSVREALLTAKEPDVLLFDQLPVALGLPSMLNDSGGSIGREQAHQFVQLLERAMQEMQTAYVNLHERIFELLATSLDLPAGDWQAARKEVGDRVSLTDGMTVDPRMRGFLAHLSHSYLDDSSWIEALGSFIARRPPRTWDDEDLGVFETELAQLSQRFKHLVQVALELGKHRGVQHGNVLRLGLVTGAGSEHEKLIVVRPKEQAVADRFLETVSRLLAENGLQSEEARMAILATLARSWLPRMEGEEGAD